MKILQKIMNFLKPVSQEELNEQYLNNSTSLEDLEWRMRKINTEEKSHFNSFN